MKTLLIIFALSVLSIGASAQRKILHYHYYTPVTRVIVTPAFGFGYGYPYYDYPLYPYWYYPYYYEHTPYRLSAEMQSIKVEYHNKIKETRHDKSISHAQRRQNIRNLKDERAQAIADAQRDFYNNRGNRNNDNNYNDNR